jgi:hypothetical protein
MKINRLLIAFFGIVGTQIAFATMFDVVNLSLRANLVDVFLVFVDSQGRESVFQCRDMKYKDRMQFDTNNATENYIFGSPDPGFDENSAKLDNIEVGYRSGERNVNSLTWVIGDLQGLNIAHMMDDNAVQISTYDYGKCDIMKDGEIVTIQGRLHDSHKENV